MKRDIFSGTIYLLYTGDYNAFTGGYIYNKKITEQLTAKGISFEPVQIPDTSFSASVEAPNIVSTKIKAMQKDAILLIDSLIYAKYISVWKKCLQCVVPLIHLPLFLDPENISIAERVKPLEIEALRIASHIIVTSAFTMNILIMEGLPASKISVVIPGVEQIERKKSYPELPQKLLCVSNINRNKNQLMLLETLNFFKQYPWTLSLVGSLETDTEYTQEIYTFIHKNTLEKRVKMEGLVPENRIQEFYLQSDLFLFPSKFETYGMVIAEALTAGVPVISNESDGITLNFKGLLIQFYNNSNSLKALLQLNLTNKRHYKDVCTRASQSFHRFPTWGEVADNLLSELKHTIGR